MYHSIILGLHSTWSYTQADRNAVSLLIAVNASCTFNGKVSAKWFYTFWHVLPSHFRQNNAVNLHGGPLSFRYVTIEQHKQHWPAMFRNFFSNVLHKNRAIHLMFLLMKNFCWHLFSTGYCHITKLNSNRITA